MATAEAEKFVYLACFTFDLRAIVAALEAARDRGAVARLLFSGRDKGLTNNQGPQLQRLRSRGCDVRAHRGSRLHAKLLLTERLTVVGSTNFTEASQSNVERAVIVSGLHVNMLNAERKWFEDLFEAASRFTEGYGEAIPATPPRR